MKCYVLKRVTAQQLFTSQRLSLPINWGLQNLNNEHTKNASLFQKKNTTHKTRNFVDPQIMSVASTRDGDAFAHSNADDVQVVLESPEMKENFNYKRSKNLKNGRNDDEEEEEEEEEKEEEEKQFINIVYEADEVCFQI